MSPCPLPQVQTYVRGYLFRMKLSTLISQFEDDEAAQGRVPSEADIGAFVHREMSAEASRLLRTVPSGRIGAGGALLDDSGQDGRSSLSPEASLARGAKGARLRKKFRDSRSRSLTREQKRELLFMVSERARHEEFDAERFSEAMEESGPGERQSGRLDQRSDYGGSDKMASPFATKSVPDRSIRPSPHVSNRLPVISEPSSPGASNKLRGIASHPTSPHTSNRFLAMAQQFSGKPPSRPSDPGYFWPEEKSKRSVTPRTSQSGAAPVLTGDRPSRTSERSLLRLFGGKRTSPNDPTDAPLSMLLDSLTQNSAIMARSKDPNDLPLADDSMDFTATSPSLLSSSPPPDSPRRTNLKKILSVIPEALEQRQGSMVDADVANLLPPLPEETISPTTSGIASPSFGRACDSPSTSSRGSRSSRSKLPPMSTKVFVSPPKK